MYSSSLAEKQASPENLNHKKSKSPKGDFWILAFYFICGIFVFENNSLFLIRKSENINSALSKMEDFNYMGKRNVLDIEKAKELVSKQKPHISKTFDKVSGPWFPEGRKDVAVFQKDAEDGSNYGRTIWYLAYGRDGQGIEVKQLHDTGDIHDNCHTWSVNIVKGEIVVRIGYGGHEPTLKTKLSDLGLTY